MLLTRAPLTNVCTQNYSSSTMKRTNTVHPNRCFAGSVALKARQYENLPRPDSPLAQPARDVTSPPPAARLARSLTDKPLPVSAAIPVQATLEDKATAPEIDALVPEPDSPSSIYTLPANHVEDDATSLLDGLSKKPTSAVLPPHISRSQSYPRTKPLPLPMKTKQPCPPHVAQIAVSAQDPWLQYQALSLDESWAGSEATIACLRHSHSSSNTLYAVRTVKGYDSEKLAKWKKITAPNIVELMQIFTLESSERTMYFAYEYIDVSLADIQAGVTLDEVHISTVCRDVSIGSHSQLWSRLLMRIGPQWFELRSRLRGYGSWPPQPRYGPCHVLRRGQDRCVVDDKKG